MESQSPRRHAMLLGAGALSILLLIVFMVLHASGTETEREPERNLLVRRNWERNGSPSPHYRFLWLSWPAVT